MSAPIRPTSDESSADADRPCHRWPIQQWACLVRRTLGSRPPTRRCQKKRRDRATRAAIKQEVSRFLEDAEGASRVAEQSEKTKAPQHGRRSSAQARRLLAPLSRGGHATLRSTSMAPRPTRGSVWNVPAAAEHGQPAAAEHGRTSGIPMEVLAWGDAATLNRPCVDCSRVTGCFCDGCFAIERDPDAYWAPGQHTPLCTACDAKHGECHHCRGLAWVAPRVWGDGATMAGYQAEAHRTGPSASFGLPRGAS